MPTPLHSVAATPSQKLAAQARRARERKIAAQAHPDSPIACPSALARTAPTGMSRPAPTPAPASASPEPARSRGRPWFWIVNEIEPPGALRLGIEEIQAAVERHCKVDHVELISARRTASLVRPRQIAMFLCRNLTPNSLPVIGRKFGGRDHTTVLHAVRKIEWLRTRDQDLASDIAAIGRALAAQAA
jgi:hypothetical protein